MKLIALISGLYDAYESSTHITRIPEVRVPFANKKSETGRTNKSDAGIISIAAVI